MFKTFNLKLIFAIIAFLFIFTGCKQNVQNNNSQNHDINLSSYNNYVTFIDVGQGDSTLIRSNDKYILIDGGDNSQENKIVDYLKKSGVDKLSLVVATHPHADHIGGLDAVIKNFDVESVMMPRLKESLVPTTKTYTDFLNAISKKGLKIKNTVPFDSFNFNEGVLEIFGPLGEYNDLNNMSAVLKYNYGDISFFIGGDMESDAENKMLRNKDINLKSTVMKLSHHASSTSNGANFLKAINPEYFVMSLGAGNKYGHPHKEVIKRLDDMKRSVYRTDINGDITFVLDQGKISNVLFSK